MPPNTRRSRAVSVGVAVQCPEVPHIVSTTHYTATVNLERIRATASVMNLEVNSRFTKELSVANQALESNTGRELDRPWSGALRLL